MFSKELKKLALKYAPKPIVSIGDIVETLWSGWKHPHKVKICKIGIQLVSINCRVRKSEESVKQWLNRVELIGADGTVKDRDGCAIVLKRFLTSDGKVWEKKNEDFNHCGLSWELNRLLNTKVEKLTIRVDCTFSWRII